MANEPFDFKNNLIAMLGAQELPEEDRLRIIDQAAELVLKRIVIRLLEDMDDDAAVEAARLADDPDKLLEHLAANGADIGMLVQQETERLKNELVVGSREEEALIDMNDEVGI